MAELIFIMGEEADAAGTSCALLAEPCAVLRRVEPALEHTMGELAAITTGAATRAAEVGAGHSSVRVLAGVSAAGVLAGVHERTLGPVMRVGPGAGPHLECEHAELIGGINAALDVRQRRIHRVLLLGTVHGDWGQRR